MSCTVVTRRPDNTGVDHLDCQLTASDVVALIKDSNTDGVDPAAFIELPQEDGGSLYVRGYSIVEIEDDA